MYLELISSIGVRCVLPRKGTGKACVASRGGPRARSGNAASALSGKNPQGAACLGELLRYEAGPRRPVLALLRALHFILNRASSHSPLLMKRVLIVTRIDLFTIVGIASRRTFLPTADTRKWTNARCGHRAFAFQTEAEWSACSVAIAQREHHGAVVTQGHGARQAAGVVLGIEDVFHIERSAPACRVVGHTGVGHDIAGQVVAAAALHALAMHAAVQFPAVQLTPEAIACAGVEAVARHVVQPLADGGDGLTAIVGHRRGGVGITSHQAQAVLEVRSEADFKAARPLFSDRDAEPGIGGVADQHIATA